MSETFYQFDKRVRRIAKKNRKIARGHVNFIDGDGLIKKRPKHRIGALPIRGLLMIAIGFFSFKGVLIAHQGQAQYDDRLALLIDGTLFERGAAWAMQIEPVSSMFAQIWSPLF
ncbi:MULTISPECIES: hypothetical protein [unclassified Marinovum]